MERRLHKQRRKNTCAVGAIRTVLDRQLDVKISEQALEAHASTATKPIIKHGCGTAEMRLIVKGASRTHNKKHKTRSWALRTSRNGSIEALILELAAGRLPIVSVLGTEDNHAMVVLAVEDGYVQFWDPAGPGEPERMNVDRFLEIWDEEGAQWYGVVVA